MSFWRAYYHLVWPTKHRAPLIDTAVEEQLHPYLVKRAAELEVYVHAINGWHDHLHLAVAIPPKHAVAHVVKHLKGASSHFINQELEGNGRFAWARGYGVLTFGERQLPFVLAYIHKQKQHHSQQTTNQWLEYASETDQGPQMPQPTNTIREENATYNVFGESPL